MNRTPSPYCVETISGTLELTKGTYLTMLKRKESTVKTLAKTKPIARLTATRTVKKQGSTVGGIRKSIRSQILTKGQILMKGQALQSHMFQVYADEQLFDRGAAIPSISMLFDNDMESEWADITHNVQELSMCLSIEAFDRRFRHP